MKEIVSLRLKNARALNGLSQQEIADRIGITKQMISKYENGIALPSSRILLQLSRIFNVKLDYFFSKNIVDLGVINFRKKSSFSKKKQESLKEKIRIQLQNYIQIENILSIDSTFNNIIQNEQIANLLDIESVVLKIRNAWEIGLDPIHNIIQLLEDQEIKVIELYDVDDKFDGLATFVNEKFPIIVVNGNFPVERKRFTLLHELGHLLLNLPDCDVKTQENFCNKFAAEFLFPKKMVVKEFGGYRDKVSLRELIEAQKKYGISIRAAMYRLVDASIISEKRNIDFYKKINSDPKLKKEVDQPRFETPEKSNRFEQLIYRALSQELITLSKAASLLNEDLEKLKRSSLI